MPAPDAQTMRDTRTLTSGREAAVRQRRDLLQGETWTQEQREELLAIRMQRREGARAAALHDPALHARNTFHLPDMQSLQDHAQERQWRRDELAATQALRRRHEDEQRAARAARHDLRLGQTTPAAAPDSQRGSPTEHGLFIIPDQPADYTSIRPSNVYVREAPRVGDTMPNDATGDEPDEADVSASAAGSPLSSISTLPPGGSQNQSIPDGSRRRPRPSSPEAPSPGSPRPCGICLQEVANTDLARTMPACDHPFHVDCLMRWVQTNPPPRCPICRQSIDTINGHNLRRVRSRTTAESIHSAPEQPHTSQHTPNSEPLALPSHAPELDAQPVGGINSALGYAFTTNTMSNATHRTSESVDHDANTPELIMCPICQDTVASPATLSPTCGHTFHNECITRWAQQQGTCPVCRVHIESIDGFQVEMLGTATYQPDENEDRRAAEALQRQLDQHQVSAISNATAQQQPTTAPQQTQSQGQGA